MSSAAPFLMIPIAAFALCTLSAETHYVAMGGSDSNSGTIRSPWLSLQRAADMSLPGDTIIVRDGTYRHGHAVTCGDGCADNYSAVVLKTSGSPTAEITFIAEHKWAVVLDCEL